MKSTTDKLITAKVNAYEKLVTAFDNEIENTDVRIESIKSAPTMMKSQQDRNEAISAIVFGFLVLVLSNAGLYLLNDINILNVKSESFKEFIEWFHTTTFILKIVMPIIVISFCLGSLKTQLENIPSRKDKYVKLYQEKTIGKLNKHKDRLLSRKANIIDTLSKLKTR